MKYRNNNYKSLEKRMIHYSNLLAVTTKENGEPFVKLDPLIVPNGYITFMNDMAALTGPQVLVRISVSEMLRSAQKKLKSKNLRYTLFVTYGYRSLEVQTKKFLEQLQISSKKYFPNPIDLYEEAQRFIAVPAVAGHPTGGAIDVIIKDERKNKTIDFGSRQYDFSTKDCYVFTNQISKEAKENRELLRNILKEVGFAPFDGEWWHFSYGDVEWAYYYKKQCALYKQENLLNLKRFMIK